MGEGLSGGGPDAIGMMRSTGVTGKTSSLVSDEKGSKLEGGREIESCGARRWCLELENDPHELCRANGGGGGSERCERGDGSIERPRGGQKGSVGYNEET